MVREIVLEKFLKGDEVGKAVDVGVQMKDGTWWAYEVQLDARSDLLKTLIERDLAAGFAHVVICIQSGKDLKKVQETIAALESSAEPADILRDLHLKVEAKLLGDFLSNSENGGSK